MITREKLPGVAAVSGTGAPPLRLGEGAVLRTLNAGTLMRPYLPMARGRYEDAVSVAARLTPGQEPCLRHPPGEAVDHGSAWDNHDRPDLLDGFVAQFLPESGRA